MAKAGKFIEDTRELFGWGVGDLVKFKGAFRIFYPQIKSGVGVGSNYNNFLVHDDAITILETRLKQPKNWSHIFKEGKEPPSHEFIQEIIGQERKFKNINITEVRYLQQLGAEPCPYCDEFHFDEEEDAHLYVAHYEVPDSYSGHIKVVHKDETGWIRIQQSSSKKIQQQFVKL